MIIKQQETSPAGLPASAPPVASHNLINQDSGNYEWYTPEFVVNAARIAVGGAFDLDPASSDLANKRVKAGQIFTESDNGLLSPWFGRVWVNHPFSRVNNPLWVDRMVDQYQSGAVTALCCITFAATSERWFRPLLAFPQCYLYGRTNYLLPDGTKKRGVTKGSVVTYMGPNLIGFAAAFQGLGAIKVTL